MTTSSFAQSDEFDITELINVILKRAWLVAGLVLCGLAAAIMANNLIRPVYEATALVMINQEDAGKIDQRTYGSFMSEEDYYRTQYRLIESRSLLERVYQNLDLNRYEQFANPNGVAKLHGALVVTPITRSRLVNIGIRAYDPQVAAEVANAVAETYVAENVSNRISMGKDVIKALENSENSAAEQELLNSMPQVVNSDFIKSLKHQAALLESQKAQLSAKYTSRHPELISVNNQLKTVNEQIAHETSRLVQSIKIELSGQFSGNNIRIIDPAIVPLYPVRPRKLVNLVLGIMGGGILGLLIVFGLEFIDQSIKSSQDLEEKLGLPFLGFIPYVHNKKRDSEYASLLKTENSLHAENIRNIRTMLDFALADQPNAPILITSSIHGEGKSHLSANLAVALAQTGKNILLVDGDLRRSRLHKMFHLSLDKGLSNIWSADAAKADFAFNVQPVVGVTKLSVMTSGQRPPNPAELLNSAKIPLFLQWAQEHYDQVLVDCPAILPVSDTMLWGKYIPRAVFLIRYGKTSTKLALSALDKLHKIGAKLLGAVIGQHRQEGFPYGKYSYDKNYRYYQYK